MIYTYPCLTSASVSSSILPGICKVLERFILIYQMDDIIKSINRRITWGKIISKAGEWALIAAATTGGLTAIGKAIASKETGGAISTLGSFFKHESCLNEQDSDAEEERKREMHSWKKRESERKEEEFNFKKSEEERRVRNDSRMASDELRTQKDSERREDEAKRKAREDEARRRKVDIETPNFTSLSVEPTWMKIDTALGTRLVGVKCVPFPVSDETNFTSLLSNDKKMSEADAELQGIWRTSVRAAWNVWTKGKRLLVPFSGTPTGDPQRDVIYGETSHGRNIFCIFNMVDLGPDFISKAQDIAKLHHLGWTSFVICDDVNKRAYFCMREFKGLCSTVLYSFMHSTLGKEHAKVFEDLDDIKKGTSPFFRLNVRSSKLLGESMANSKKYNYFIMEY